MSKTEAHTRTRVMGLTCTFCGRPIDAPPEQTYRAIDGWETIDDGRTELKWRSLDSYACRSCVDEHFVGLDERDDDDAARP